MFAHSPVTQNSPTLQASENFTWSTCDNLGRGATATVYLGRHKSSGDVHAIKVFHDRNYMHLSSSRLRELEVLQRVKHRNIIQLFAIEKELCSGNQILVMELCSGGSLYTMLDQPEYAYGFPEDEFKTFLGDIASGMQYLRQNGIIHRDIKPGNIMRYIDDDGRSVYKLTDFGAARELQEEETFMSIYGTEEYLHPDMYQRAVLKRPGGQRFDASVDLWSVGVAIYHMATGHLPFQPFGGRNNSQTMHRITTEKASGVISGIQYVEGGPIVWRRELPKTCLLSESLKLLITPMLARLVECDASKMMSFDEFFNTVRNILEMQTLNVFHCSAGANATIYVNKTDTYSKLQEKLALESEIPAAEQLLLYMDRELSELVDLTAEIHTYPRVILIGQLFLFHKDRLESQKLVVRELPSYPNFTNSMALDKDVSLAQRCCAIAYLIERITIIVLKDQELIRDAETSLRSYIRRRITITHYCLPDMGRIMDETKKRQDNFFNSYRTICDLLDILIYGGLKNDPSDQNVQECREILGKAVTDTTLKDVFKKAETRVEEIRVYMSILTEKISEQEREAIGACVGCQEEDHCLSKVKNLRRMIESTWKLFVGHRKQRTLNSHEEFIHKSERQKLQEGCVKILSVLQGHCIQNLNKSYSVILKQISVLTKNFARTRKVESNVTSVLECQKQLSSRLDKIEGECRQAMEHIQKVLRKQLSTVPEERKTACEQDEQGALIGQEQQSASPYTGNYSHEAQVQKLSIELHSLGVETSKLKEMIQANTEIMKSFLKETKSLNVESFEQWAA